jgi:hypothetical protein
MLRGLLKSPVMPIGVPGGVLYKGLMTGIPPDKGEI